jgi:CheY-like chemotaxis protein
MYGDYLRAHGFDVTTESSGVEALERLLGDETFDLVITDIMMAKMDGWELLDAIRNDLKLDGLALPVIIISAFESDTLEVEALGKGANGSFVKGNDPLSSLLKQVRIQTGRERSKYSDTDT